MIEIYLVFLSATCLALGVYVAVRVRRERPGSLLEASLLGLFTAEGLATLLIVILLLEEDARIGLAALAAAVCLPPVTGASVAVVMRRRQTQESTGDKKADSSTW
ncbi:MAG: hypothetical protein Q8K99_01920 [Actinomycetota bacterium]|nr:hypothetical protein [Actinomycetota bacterium]